MKRNRIANNDCADKTQYLAPLKAEKFPSR